MTPPLPERINDSLRMHQQLFWGFPDPLWLILDPAFLEDAKALATAKEGMQIVTVESKRGAETCIVLFPAMALHLYPNLTPTGLYIPIP